MKLLQKKRKLYTPNLTPGKTFFDMERECSFNGVVYRELNPERSKFGAAIVKGLQQTGLQEDSIVLYLGASHGYTPSFFSDLIPKGMIFCLDFAPRVVRDLYFISKERKNMAPILADATKPETYKHLVPEVDVVFQDIAQRDQLGIFLKNCDMYLKKGGHAMLALKARSQDVSRKPKDVFKDVRKLFEERKDYVIIDYRELDPLEKDHAFFTIRKK